MDIAYENWKKEKKTQELLSYISEMGTIDVSQASEFLNEDPTVTQPFLEELKNNNLIQKKVGDFYQLAVKGYKLSRFKKYKK